MTSPEMILPNNESTTVSTRKPIASFVMMAVILFCVTLSFLNGAGTLVAAAFSVMLVLGLIFSVGESTPSRWTL